MNKFTYYMRHDKAVCIYRVNNITKDVHFVDLYNTKDWHESYSIYKAFNNEWIKLTEIDVILYGLNE